MSYLPNTVRNQDEITEDSNSPVKIWNWGCCLAEITPPGGHNICLRLEQEPSSPTDNSAYFGETIGRVANRISEGSVKLNGKVYQLEKNGDNGQNTLHGGQFGWGKRRWAGPLLDRREDSRGVLMNAEKYMSSSYTGDAGFPGTVSVRAWWTTYHIDNGTKVVLELEYEALLDGPQQEGIHETVVAMTNHSYFNLCQTTATNPPIVKGTKFILPTTLHLEIDSATKIPTGKLVHFPEDGPIQPNKEITMTADEPVLDTYFVLNDDPSSIPLDSRKAEMRTCFRTMHPESGVHLLVESTEPGFQVYTGDGIDVKSGNKIFGARTGIAIEPGRYTNACNQSEWKNMVRLRPGELYGSRIRYTTWKEGYDPR